MTELRAAPPTLRVLAVVYVVLNVVLIAGAASLDPGPAPEPGVSDER